MTAILGAAALSLALAAPAAAQSNPDMAPDFARMMGWLSNELSQGLGFNAGSTFDPPHEMRPWKMQPDISLGVGYLPLNKSKLRPIETPALREKDPAGTLPGKVTFPNLTLHMRYGLPQRMDISIRGANMTVPKGYRLSGKTKGDGQSNSIGLGVRRHFFGGDKPLLSVAGNFNHVKGYFNFRNEYNNLELVPGFFVDSVNHGRLEWNVNSLGVNAVVSRTYGNWTPFFGTGWNYMTGSVKARLQADFATPLIAPTVGEASDHPEEHQARAIFGVHASRKYLDFFVNGEMKAIGASAGRSFILSMGFVAPFRIGAHSLIGRAPKAAKPEAVATAPRPAARPAPLVDYREAFRKRSEESVGPEEEPELIFIR